MIKLVNFIGARPQIIKAAAISRAISLKYQKEIEEIIIHTGQHYDVRMSQVFFDEMGIPQAHRNLKVGSASHGKQTGKILSRAEKHFRKIKPDVVIVYGDTNSTLAGALAAAKMHIPVVHIEAGMRSFNKDMPEEINRISTDHMSTLLFAPTVAAFKNLIHEGFRPENEPPYSVNNPKIYHCGDIMYDNALYYGELAEKNMKLLDDLGISEGEYVLVTIHRDLNTDDPVRLNTLISTILELSENEDLVFVLPVHPRTTKAMEEILPGEVKEKIKNAPNLRLVEPVSFLEMILLEKKSRMIMTDSGGVQKEAHFYRKNCIVFRNETEWVELVKNGTATLVDADPVKIRKAFRTFMKETNQQFPTFYGDGHAAEFICREIIDNLNR